MTVKLDKLENNQKSALRTVNCRGCVGGDCFLIRGKGANILIDSGFAFSAEAAAEKIKNELQDERLDYILLTHSHYDHAMGISLFRKIYPEVKVIGSEYCNYILNKPTARKKMQEMDDKAAKAYGIEKAEDLTELLYCDITLKEDEEISLGDETVKAVSLPGHTKCCMGYFFTEEKMLISCETLGILADEKMIFPGCLIGYQITLDSIDKALTLGAKEILIPHSGYLYGEDAEEYLKSSKEVTTDCKNLIIDAYKSGKDFDGIVRVYREKYYSEEIAKNYPEHALMANLSAQIPMFISECANQ